MTLRGVVFQWRGGCPNSVPSIDPRFRSARL